MTLIQWKALAIFLLILSVLGCRQTADQVESSPPQEEALPSKPMQVSVKSEVRDNRKDVLAHLTSVSVLLNDGTEIVIDKEKFAEKFQDRLTAWGKSEEEVSKGYSSTLLLRSSQQEPVIVQVSPEGVKWDHAFYQGKGTEELANYIKEAAAKNFLKQLNVYHMVVTAKDLEYANPLAGEQAEQVMQTLRGAEVHLGKPRLSYPLYPYYVIDMDVGGKDMVQVEVISPTLLSVKLGEDRYDYQINGSIFTPLKEAVSIIDFSHHNIKYLFKAGEMTITDSSTPYLKTSYSINKDKVNPFEEKSIIHDVVRRLAQGEQIEGSELQAKEPLLTLHFKIGKEEAPVFVYADHYTYRQFIYKKSGILEEIQKEVLDNPLFLKH